MRPSQLPGADRITQGLRFGGRFEVEFGLEHLPQSLIFGHRFTAPTGSRQNRHQLPISELAEVVDLNLAAGSILGTLKVSLFDPERCEARQGV